MFKIWNAILTIKALKNLKVGHTDFRLENTKKIFNSMPRIIKNVQIFV